MATRSSRPSAEDLANVNQLGVAVFSTPQLTWPDGTPMELLLRARTFQQRARCERAAIKAGLDLGIEFDSDTYAIMSVFYGLIQPQLTEAQIPILWSMHAAIINALADRLEEIEAQPARDLTATLESLAGVSIPAPESKKSRTRRPADADIVDRGLRSETESAGQ